MRLPWSIGKNGGLPNVLLSSAKKTGENDVMILLGAFYLHFDF
ncbi:hypothetical protein EZS27_019335 [termite gut metagenome]|uniref:Uncharacterized protein n=1 Tax=termite gut metagenome TaxID=433724 RepID=A0A5J4RER0_9ZZZZ